MGDRPPLRRRAVLAVPNGMTFANLFFGVFAIVAASRGDFATAGLYVVLGGVADMLDGRIARATDTGTRIGAELDSLVDVISFGLAPAMVMYFAVLNRNGWDWVWSFGYVAAAAWRLAVFNVEQAGRAKKYFHGLPSPAAGLTLATYYWFSQTPLYTETNIAHLPWHQMLRWVMLGLSALMVSPVPYPVFPTLGIKNRREIISTVIVLAAVIGMFWIPREFFFPACLVYVLYGILKTFLLGLLNRRADNDPTTIAVEDVIETGRHSAPVVSVASAPRLKVSADAPMPDIPAATSSTARRRRRRRPRGNNTNRPDHRPDRSDRSTDSDSSSSSGSSGE
jgi:CDP-diacylglycerol--serine O-phosphatidyltransferase